jgi:uncharacterized protein (DUF486 family)
MNTTGSFAEEAYIMLKNLANLIKVKTIVTLVVLAVFSVLALRGDFQPDTVMVVVSMVVSFYFGTQHEKTANPTRDQQDKQ